MTAEPSRLNNFRHIRHSPWGRPPLIILFVDRQPGDVKLVPIRFAESVTTRRKIAGRTTGRMQMFNPLKVSIHAAAAMVAGCVLLAGPAAALELKLAHFMSPKHPMDRFIMRPWTEQIAKQSGGALKIRIYPGGALGKGPVAQFKRAVDGPQTK